MSGPHLIGGVSLSIPTPFHGRTSALNEKQAWRDWSGYLAAASYEPTHEREYYAIRNAAALIDVSPLFKYDVTGPEALLLVNKIMTRDFGRCQIGQVMYSPWCDEQGHMIDDGTVWRIAEDQFRITAADPSLRWFQDVGFGMDARVSDVSDNLAAVALQGPNSRSILADVVSGAELDDLNYYHLAKVDVEGFPLTITRTGYTGDLGFELWVSPEHAERLWDILMAAGQGYGLLPAGMVALDIARIEAGLLLIEVDYVSAPKALIPERKSTPFEAGLGWAVGLDKGPFVGRRALLAQKESGAKWAMAGLEIDWLELEHLFAEVDLPPMVAGQASREAVPVYDGRRQVGQATSRTFSPIQKRYIGLATLEREAADLGADLEIEVTVEYARRRCRARVVKTPFFDPARKRL
ncbi:MAG: aminomethyltransferase family protein [Chloroflexota bacterium]|nr:MAG: aminomethyltransferase family protein [Chloroflexota bacterium]